MSSFIVYSADTRMNGWWGLVMGWCGVGGGVDWLTKWYGMILSLLVVSRVLLMLATLE